MENQLPKEDSVIKEQIQTAPTPKKPIPKMMIILGIVGLLIIALLVTFTVLRNQKIKDLTVTPVEKTEPKGSILFATPTVDLSKSTTGTVDVEINTGGNLIKGAVIAIKYNPLLLRNVKLEPYADPASAISNSFDQTEKALYDTANGTALLTLDSLAPSPLTGKGKIARVTFAKNNLDVAVDSTDILLLPQTNFLTLDGYIPLTKNQVSVSF